ncbi:MAG: hypothetical protein H7A45_05330 [Verrucomicrobiales bacterium]|nr:hypothetical protein [Verrucomicrobiales bacterium]
MKGVLRAIAPALNLPSLALPVLAGNPTAPFRARHRCGGQQDHGRPWQYVLNTFCVGYRIGCLFIKTENDGA